MKLARLSLTTKFALIHALLVAMLVGVTTVGWRMLPDEQNVAGGITELGRAQHTVQNADMLHDALHAGLLATLLAGQVDGLGSEDDQRQLSRDVAEFRGDLRALSTMPLPPALRASATAARDSGEHYADEVERIARLALADVRAARAAMTGFRTSFDAAKAALGSQTAALAAEIEAAHERAHRAAERARLVLLAVAVLAVACGLGLVALVGRSIRRSLIALRDVARDVADGDLDRRSERQGSDEIGQLAGSVNQMAGTLQQMIERMRDDADRAAFRTELGQALEMADSEPQACAAASRAMMQISLMHPMELLVADASDANLERAVVHPAAGAAGCGVDSPYGCVAVRSGHAMVFPDSDALNACPHLRDRPDGQLAAMCVPVSFMGRALGVLHAAGPVAQPLTEPQRDRVAALGLALGSRIGTVRAFERTQLQASTDALTGLANRRTVEKRLRDLAQRHEPHALVMCDLDHFKRLNDTHGHPAGDDALRLFSEVARGCVRDTDLAGRWGGEEFAFVLVGADADTALAWCARVRTRLAAALQQRSTPGFTASFGVASLSQGFAADQLVRLADEALYRAKRQGRDRAALAQPAGAEADGPLHRQSEQDAAVDLRMLADPA